MTAASGFTLWLRNHAEALVNRCAAWIQRHRMQRAQAQLPSLARKRAAFWRARYLARARRLEREREAREARRGAHAASAGDLPAAPEINKADVLAAIERSRISREMRLKAGRESRENR